MKIKEAIKKARIKDKSKKIKFKETEDLNNLQKLLDKENHLFEKGGKMKVKELIEILNDMDKDSNIWLDVPYIKETTSPYDIRVNDFNVEKVWDNIDKKYHVTLSSNYQLYDHFEDIKIPVRVLKHW